MYLKPPFIIFSEVFCLKKAAKTVRYETISTKNIKTVRDKINLRVIQKALNANLHH